MNQRTKRFAAGVAALMILSGSGFGAGQVKISQAEEPMKINYSSVMSGGAMSPVTDDNRLCVAGAGGFLSTLQANLLNQPAGMSGTVEYQVNSSGAGWLDWAANGTQTGDVSGNAPLEAIRMRLSGQLQEQYDIYYSVLQAGSWTGWAMNGNDGGTAGAGFRVEGIKISVTAKGAGEPAAQPEPVQAASIDPSKPMVALTFDDGPNAAVTDRILNSLEANGGKATFFMVGNRVSGSANVASVQRMAQLGCEVANHTYEHKTLTKLSSSAVSSQLSRANDAIKAACGVSPVLMRPPGGAKNGTVLEAAGSLGMSSVLWNVDTLDWKTRNKQQTIDAVLNHVKDGDIVLMHDLYATTADAAEVIIPELRARGYQLVTVSEMASLRGGIRAGGSYSSFPNR